MPDIIGLFNTAAAVCDETEVFRVAIAKRHYNKGTVEGLRSAIAHLKVVETADLCLLIGTLEHELIDIEIGQTAKIQLRPYQQALIDSIRESNTGRFVYLTTTPRGEKPSFVEERFKHPDQLDWKDSIKWRTEYPCEYLGHHGTSGLQQHPIGDEYPFVIYGVGAADGTKKWAVLNGATGWYSDKRHDTYQQAQNEIKEITTCTHA